MFEVIGICKFAIGVVENVENWKVENVFPTLEFILKMHIQNHVKPQHLYIFPTIIKGVHLLTIFANISMLDIWQGFECASKGGSPFNNCESRNCKIRSLNMRSISFCSRPHVFTSFWRLKKKFNWLEPFFSRWRMMTSKQIKHKRTSMCDVSN